jgi:hypothetical protein
MEILAESHIDLRMGVDIITPNSIFHSLGSKIEGNLEGNHGSPNRHWEVGASQVRMLGSL